MELRETATEGKFEVIYDFATAPVRMYPTGVADNFEEVLAGEQRIFHCKRPCYVEYVTIGEVLQVEVRSRIFPGMVLVVNLRLFLTQA